MFDEKKCKYERDPILGMDLRTGYRDTSQDWRNPNLPGPHYKPGMDPETRAKDAEDRAESEAEAEKLRKAQQDASKRKPKISRKSQFERDRSQEIRRPIENVIEKLLENMI